MTRAEIKSWFKKIIAIDETVGLHKNHSFRLAIFLPVLLSAIFITIFSIQLAIDGQFKLSITQPNVTAFIRYFTFPISLLSLSIFFGVMVARFHSSKQKAKSNEITERNNSVNYFYKTHEEFEKYCKKLVESKECKFSSLRSDICYSALFCESSPEEPSLIPCERFFRRINKLFSIYSDDYVKSIKVVDSNQFNDTEEVLIFASPNVLMKELGMSFIDYGQVDSPKDVNARLYEIYNSVVDLFYFPGMEQRDESTRRLNEIYLKYTNIINKNSKHIELMRLQTPQS